MPPPKSKSPLIGRPNSTSSSSNFHPSKFLISESTVGSQSKDESHYESNSLKTEIRSSPSHHLKPVSTTSPIANPASEASTSNNSILHNRIRRASDPGGSMDTEEVGSVASSDDHPGSAAENRNQTRFERKS